MDINEARETIKKYREEMSDSRKMEFDIDYQIKGAKAHGVIEGHDSRNGEVEKLEKHIQVLIKDIEELVFTWRKQ